MARLATSRYDFQNHIDGYSFRHNSFDIDVNPAVIIQGNSYITVGDTLNAISNDLIGGLTAGQGFISFDGYNTYHNQITTPDTPYDSSIPSINGVLNDILTNPNNPAHSRLYDGGIILIKAGTYKITSPINIPPGITIMGEGFGTKIINQTSPLAPMFVITPDIPRVVDHGVNPFSTFMFARETKFYNLLIADNFVEPKFLGDLSYKVPQNTSTNNPLISVQAGSHFTAECVKFVGKTSYTISTLNSVTAHAIKTDETDLITSGTIVNVKDCFFDGFSIPIFFGSLGGTNDYFSVFNNYIRYFGFLNSDLSLPQNNCCINSTVCNIEIQQNYLYGDEITAIPFLYLSSVTDGYVNIQAKSKINFSNNDLAIDKTNNTVPTPQLVVASSNVLMNSSDYLFVSENNLFNQYEIYFDNFSAPQITINDSNINIGNNISNVNLIGDVFLSTVSGNIIGSTNTNETLRFGFNIVDVSGGSNYTLNNSQYNSQMIELIGTITNNINVILPTVSGYSKLIKNNTTFSGNPYDITVKTLSGNGVLIPNGSSEWVFCDGTNIESGTFQQRETSIDSNTTFLYRCNEISSPLVNLGSFGSANLTNSDTPPNAPIFSCSGVYGNSIGFPNNGCAGFVSGSFGSLPILSTSVSISCWFSQMMIIQVIIDIFLE